MSWAAVASVAATVITSAMQKKGSNQQAAGAIQNAEAIAKEKAFEAEQQRQQAGQAEAVGQIQAAEQRRQARLVQSRTLAVAGASGAGVTDPTIVNILGNVAGQGAYRSNVAIYGGEEKARILNMQAAASDYEGRNAIEAGNLRAKALETQGDAAILGGVTSLFTKYNAGLFNFGGTTGGTNVGGPTSAGDIPIFS